MESKKINQLATNLAPTTSDLTVVGDPVNGELKKITLLQIASLFGAGLTSVGMVVPSGFSVSPASLTSSGTFTITGSGNSLQYIDGTGALQTLPSIVSPTRTISTTSPLSGGGDLSANRTLSISQASTSVNGYLTSTDWNTFNSKESALTFSAPLSRATNTISIPVATSLVNGYLSSTDWSTFNSKQGTITLTTTGSSGASTFVTGTLNVPTYTLAGLGGFANPMTTLGDLIYGGASGTATRIAGNITASKQFLSQTGTGTISAIPSWSSIAGSDITGAALTKTDDTNVTLTLGGTPATSLLRAASITVGWTGTLADARITSAATWNAKESALTFSSPLSRATNTISIPVATSLANGYLSSTDWSTFNGKQSSISLTVSGSSGAATFVTNTLNIPTYTLAGLGGQASSTNLTSLSGLTYISASFVKMTASGTFTLDTSTYLTTNQTITLSGDISGSGSTAITTTIGSNKVTNAMLAQIATGTFHGRVTAATGNVETLSGTQATTLLDVFSSTLKGLAPASGGGTTNFLRADGTWAAPATGGTGTVTSVAMTVPTGLTIGGSPITTSGTLAITFTAGYSIPTTASQTNWDSAYTNRITSLTTTGSSGAATLITNVLNIPSYTLAGLGGQASSTNLTSLSGLTFVSTSFVKMSAAGTFVLDTNTYLTTTSAGTTYVPYTGATGTLNLGTNPLQTSGNVLGGKIGIVEAAGISSSAGYTIINANTTYFAFARSGTQYVSFTYPAAVQSYTLPAANGTLALTSDIVNQTITLSGDISGSGTTAITTAIGSNKVTNAMLAQVVTASFLGRVTAATGNVETLTATQATSLLNNFTSTLKGLVPLSGGGTTNFLRADGTWAAPSGSTDFYTTNGTLTSARTITAAGFGLTYSDNKNGQAAITISNTTAGTTSAAGLIMTSDATSGNGLIAKLSSTYTTSALATSNDLALINYTAGDIIVMNTFASGLIKFGVGTSTTAQMTLTNDGHLLVGTTTNGTYFLDVNGDSNIGGTLYVTYPNSSRPSINFATSGTLRSLPLTGDMEMDGTGKLYFTHNDTERGIIPAYQFFKPNAAIALNSGITTIQPIFNTITNGAVTLKSSTNYVFEMLLYITGMSTTSGTFGIAFGGTHTYTTIGWQTLGSKVNNISNTASHQSTFNIGSSNATLVTASAFANGYMRVWGSIRVATSGTFIPQITLGVASAAFIQPQSYFRITALSAGSVDYIGNWS